MAKKVDIEKESMIKMLTPETFNLDVKQLSAKMPVMDAILFYCEQNKLEYYRLLEQFGNNITQKQEKILKRMKRNFTHITDLVNAYWIAMEKCNPGELYLIGSDETEKIYTYREIIDKLISLSSNENISVKQVPEYTRPTAVPRLIGDTSKFRKLTGWKPELSVDKILEDTLDYWRDFVKNNDY